MRRREFVVVTPEHVEIRLEPAGLGSRFLALLTDAAIIMSIAATIGGITAKIAGPGIGMAVLASVSLFLSIAYHIWFETRREGRSPGKKITGLRVVDARGLPIGLEQSLVRNITRTVDFLPAFYALGAIVALFDPNGRRFGDLLADTMVIREDTPLEAPASLASVRKYNSLRTPRVMRMIRHRISLEERELLLSLVLRGERLEPGARYDLMEEVGNWYRDRLGIDDPNLSGENLVRGLTSIVFSRREGSVE
ncbi:MAG: RDD family protein [Thermoanaerobaculia bacterium]